MKGPLVGHRLAMMAMFAFVTSAIQVLPAVVTSALPALAAPTLPALGVSGVLTLVGAATPAAAAPAAAPGTRYVYLIRHGMYDRDRNVDDRVGNGLNALGHEQAALVGKRLAMLPVKLTMLVSSDYTRARETADDMGKVLGMTPARDSLLHECTPTTERADIVQDHTPAEFAACEGNLQAAWAKYMRPSPDGDAHDVLVCHGNVIRWFVSKAVHNDTRNWSFMDIGNASITVIAVRADGTTRLVIYSDVGHLPVEKTTWTGRGAGWTGKAAVPRPDSTRSEPAIRSGG